MSDLASAKRWFGEGEPPGNLGFAFDYGTSHWRKTEHGE